MSLNQALANIEYIILQKMSLDLKKKKKTILVYIYLTLGRMNIMSYIYGHLIFPSDSSVSPPLPTWYIVIVVTVHFINIYHGLWLKKKEIQQ